MLCVCLSRSRIDSRFTPKTTAILTLWVLYDMKPSLIFPHLRVFFDVLKSFKNYFNIFIKYNLTNVRFLVLCCRVRETFQAPQAACGRSVTHHSLPEDAFKIPTCSVVILPSHSVPPLAYGKGPSADAGVQRRRIHTKN